MEAASHSSPATSPPPASTHACAARALSAMSPDSRATRPACSAAANAAARSPRAPIRAQAASNASASAAPAGHASRASEPATERSPMASRSSVARAADARRRDHRRRSRSRTARARGRVNHRQRRRHVRSRAGALRSCRRRPRASPTRGRSWRPRGRRRGPLRTRRSPRADRRHASARSPARARGSPRARGRRSPRRLRGGDAGGRGVGAALAQGRRGTSRRRRRVARILRRELGEATTRRFDVADGVRPHRRDEREAARDVRIALERSELVDRHPPARRVTLDARPVEIDELGGERLEHAPQPRPLRRVPDLPQRLRRELVLAARRASAIELEQQRNDFTVLRRAARHEAFGGVFVPGRVAAHRRHRPREPRDRAGGHAVHRRLAQRRLRARRVARTHAPDPGGEHERATARFVRREVVGERLELRRERGRVPAIGQKIELERAGRERRGIALDGARERLRGRGCRRPCSPRARPSASRATRRRRRLLPFRAAPPRDRPQGRCRPSSSAMRTRNSIEIAASTRPGAFISPLESASRARSRICAALAISPLPRRTCAARSHASAIIVGLRAQSGTPSESPRSGFAVDSNSRRPCVSSAVACASPRVRASSVPTIPASFRASRSIARAAE